MRNSLVTLGAISDAVARTTVKIADVITESCGWVSRVLVAILIPVGFLNVFLRYVGRYTETQLVNNTWIEAQWYLYGVIFLLMFPYLLRHDGNVRVDFWYAERSRKVKTRIDLIGHLVALAPFVTLAVWVSWKPVRDSWSIWEVSPDPGGLPRAPLKAMILVAFLLLGLQTIATLIRLAARLTGREIGIRERRSDAPLRIE